MLRVFITSSYQNSENKNEIEHLCSIVKSAGFEDFCFIRDIENYEKVFDNPKDLMKSALEEINKSDLLLIDMTEKPTGRAFEAGMAYALNKKIIMIMKKGTELKDTSKGIADEIIEYESIEEIEEKLKQFV